VISERRQNLLILNVVASDRQPKISIINFINFIQTHYKYIIVTDLVQTNDSSVDNSDELYAARMGFDSRGDNGFFSVSERPDWLWGPSSLLSNGYWGRTLSGNKAAEA
jgi:hypothetical protein